MPDYDLSRFDTRSFQQLVQALALKIVGPNVTPFGDGRDGGRDATCEGLMKYATGRVPWEGYLVIQAKSKLFTGNTGRDGDWVCRELRQELKAFAEPGSARRRPDYYILATNVRLTAVPATGSRDRVSGVFDEFKGSLRLKGHDVWDYVKICRLLDDTPGIRTTYALVEPGDVLNAVAELGRSVAAPQEPVGSTIQANEHSGALAEEDRIVWVVRLDVDEANLDAGRLEHIRSELERMASAYGDMQILETRTGSLEIRVRSRFSTYRSFREAWRGGRFEEISGLRIAQIDHLNSGQLTELIQERFAAASSTLLRWPTTIQDRWIERAELGPLAEKVEGDRKSATFVLGGPGLGKSALLAHLGKFFAAKHVPLLALKCDTLPADISSARELSRHLDLPLDAAACLETLAQDRPVVVILDQLDALASLVDLLTNRLNAVLELLQQARRIENVHIFASCRSFDFRHDLRLSGEKGDSLELTPLDWSQVKELLAAEGREDLDRIPQKAQGVLGTPQHLKVFLDLDRRKGGARFYDTYQEMLDQLWAERVTSESARELLERVAAEVAGREELWVPMSAFPDEDNEIDNLERQGILQRDEQGRRIAFGHQTFYEYVRAGTFVQGGQDLAVYTLERQDGLSIRPVLWTTLAYLRAKDRVAYELALASLWFHQKLRIHVRYLLIDFLGQVVEPGPLELWCCLSGLQNDELRDSILLATAGQEAWFRAVSSAHLDQLMAGEMALRPQVPFFLARAFAFSPAEVLSAVEAHWMRRKEDMLHAWVFLSDLPSWEPRATEMARRILSCLDVGEHRVMWLARRAARYTPEAGGTIAMDYLRKTWTNLQQENPAQAATSQGSALAPFERNRLLQRFLEHQPGLHGLREIAEGAPELFVRELGVLICEVLSRLSRPLQAGVQEYMSSDCHVNVHLGTVDRSHHPIPAAFSCALIKMADDSPDQLIPFISTYAESEFRLMHRLLVGAFLHLAERHPHVAFGYLVGDPRRLAVGDYHDPIQESAELISRLVPRLDQKRQEELERAVLDYSVYTEDYEYEEDPQDRAVHKRHHFEANLRRRKLLLACFPEGTLSPDSERILGADREAINSARKEGRPRIIAFTSPMSAKQMGMAKDADILHLFEILTDDREEHPRPPWREGSFEASRQFAEFAEAHPDRAARMLREFRPEAQSQPVSYAVEALCKSEYPIEELQNLILELDGKGFRSDTFCTSCAHGLEARLRAGKPTPDVLLDLMEEWLGDAKLWVPSDETKTKSESPEGENDKEVQSVLWDDAGFFQTPQGANTVAEVLSLACLLRKPVDGKRWLRVLRAFLARDEGASSWTIMEWNYLPYLSNVGMDQAVSFARDLFARYPSLRDSRAGLAFLVKSRGWMTSDELRAHLVAVRRSTWDQGRLAWGEAITLMALDRNVPRWVSAENEKILARSGDVRERRGAANSAVHRWKEDQARERATEVLVRLLDGPECGIVGEGVMRLFHSVDPQPPGVHMSRLLQAIAKRPWVLTTSSWDWLAQHLKEAAKSSAELTAGVVAQMVRIYQESAEPSGRRWSFHEEDLINVTLTLQRNAETREQGMDLFEILLRSEVSGVADVLKEVDEGPARPQ